MLAVAAGGDGGHRFKLGDKAFILLQGRVIARSDSLERPNAVLLELETPWRAPIKRFVDEDLVLKEDEVDDLPYFDCATGEVVQ